MIKCETLGMFSVAKNNPIIKMETDIKNYSFITYDGEVYLISNTRAGDDAYVHDYTIPAGEFLRGFRVKDWEGQKLVIDLKHITADAVNKGDILVPTDDGTLEIGAASGVYLTVTDTGVALTGDAIKAKVCVA